MKKTPKKKKSTDEVLKDIFDPVSPLLDRTRKNGGPASPAKKLEAEVEEVKQKSLLFQYEKKIGQVPEESIIDVENGRGGSAFDDRLAKTHAPEPIVDVGNGRDRSLPQVEETPVPGPTVEAASIIEPVTDVGNGHARSLPEIKETAAPEPAIEAPAMAEPVVEETASVLVTDVGNGHARSLQTTSYVPLITAGLCLFLVAFGIVDALWVAQKNELSRTRDLLASRQAELADLEHRSVSDLRETAKTNALAAGIVRQRRGFENGVNFLRAASLSGPRRGPALSALGHLERQGLWFESFLMKGQKIKIYGFTSDQVSVLKFLGDMNASPYFKNSHVFSIQEARGANAAQLYAFEIDANVNF